MAKRKKDTRPFWTGDCETDPFKHGRVPKPFIWGLYTGAGFHMFDTAEEFVEFVRDCDVIVGFHNGGKFDFHFILSHIALFDKITVINGRLVVAHIGKCELRDTYNLFPVPLAAYKKDDVKKLKAMLKARGVDPSIANDYEFMEAEHRKDPRVMEVIRHYLKNDCVFLYELVEASERKEGRHLTRAGAAMARWERVSGLKRPKTDKEFFDKFVKFYYGGRVQCFQKGKVKGPIKVYDIISAYPAAMCSPHPHDPLYVTQSNPTEFKPTSFLTVDCRSSGGLPMRANNGNIEFPDDHEYRTYYVCGHELIAAMETGSVSEVNIKESIDFLNLVDMTQFIMPAHEARQIAKANGDAANTLLEKLDMNSLSGKYGANPENYGNFICVPFNEIEDNLTDGYEFAGMIGPHALLRSPLNEWQEHYINVATIASITSQNRAKLHRAIVSCDGPVYCDTDSLACRSADLDLGNELGQWKYEGEAHTMYVGGKKLYLCDGLMQKNPNTGKLEPKMATKGARLTPAQIKHICGGDTITYKPIAPTFSLTKAPVFTDRRIRMT